MPRVLWSALNSRSVSAVLLAVAVGVAYVPRDRIDPEAIEAAAREPDPRHAEGRGFRFPAPDAYPLPGRPWIKSREDLIAHFTQGEDPDLVRRYAEGPEQELLGYLGELLKRGEPPARLAPSARVCIAATQVACTGLSPARRGPRGDTPATPIVPPPRRGT